MSERLTIRNEEFMIHDISSQHKSRETFSVNLRKKKRNQLVQKKRKSDCFNVSNTKLPVELAEELKELKGEDLDSLNFIDVCKLLSYTSHINKLLEYLNALISRNEELAKVLVELKLLETIVSVLDPSVSNVTLRQVTLLICNILALNDNVALKMISFEIVPRLFSILNPGDTLLTENILWCFANLACESEQCARILLEDSVFDIVEKLELDFKTNLTDSLIESFGFFLRSISRFTVVLDENTVKKVIKFCKKYIINNPGAKSKNFILTLSKISDVEDFIDFVYNENIFNIVLELLQIPSLTSSVLKFIKSVSIHDIKYSLDLVQNKILDDFNRMIDSEDSKIVAPILFSLHNFVCCDELKEIILDHEIFTKLIKKVMHPSEEVQLEASYFFKSFVVNCENSIKVKALNQGLLEPLEHGLKSSQKDILCNYLIVSYHILRMFFENDFVVECQGVINIVNSIKELQNFKNDKVSDIAEEIILSYNL